MKKLILTCILITIATSVSATTMIKEKNYHEIKRAQKIEACIHNSKSWCKKHLICQKTEKKWCELKYRLF